VRGLMRFGAALALAGAALGAPPAAEPVQRMLSRLTVGRPLRYENLTLFPLYGTGSARTAFALLDEAIRAGAVHVREKDGGQVNTVQMRNVGKSPVFGMAGEIVSGAKQDRMLEDDVLLPPNSGWLDVPVYCTEHGRWTGGAAFGTKGHVAAGRVRERAAMTGSQEEVWAEVDAAREALDVTSPTKAFAKVYDQPGVQQRIAGYTERLGSLPLEMPGALGVLAAVGGRVVCVDLFGSARLFGDMWPKLLRSYSIDALSQESPGALTQRQARRFLATAARARLTFRSSVGAGAVYRVTAPNASGSALKLGTAVVHVDLFPIGSPESREEGAAPRLDVRRERGSE
jgi:hypothetical protein